MRAEHGEAERVTRQAKEREEFYMDQAHLLKNPLQAITQRMERITSGSPVDEETRDVLEHRDREVAHATRLLCNLAPSKCQRRKAQGGRLPA